MDDQISGGAERTVVIDSDALRSLGGFLPIPRAIARRRDLTAAAKLAYGQLLAYGWEKEFSAAAQERLADDLGMSERNVRYVLIELRTAGLIDWARRGQGRPNLYAVRLPANLAAQERQSASGLERQPASALERQPASGHSLERKRLRKEETTSLFPTANTAAGSPTAQPSSKQPTWLQELNEDHRDKCGGNFSRFAAVGKALKPHHERLGAELRRRWQFYLARTEVPFVSALRFAETITAYEPPPGWQPGHPVPEAPRRAGGALDPTHPDSKPPDGADKYASLRQREAEQQRGRGPH